LYSKKLLVLLQKEGHYRRSTVAHHTWSAASGEDVEDSRVAAVEKTLEDLQMHTKDNSNHIRLVATEIELSRKDMAEVITLLKGRPAPTHGMSDHAPRQPHPGMYDVGGREICRASELYERDIQSQCKQGAQTTASGSTAMRITSPIHGSRNACATESPSTLVVLVVRGPLLRTVSTSPDAPPDIGTAVEPDISPTPPSGMYCKCRFQFDCIPYRNVQVLIFTSVDEFMAGSMNATPVSKRHGRPPKTTAGKQKGREGSQGRVETEEGYLLDLSHEDKETGGQHKYTLEKRPGRP
jgi:hypothetical protein